MLHPKAFANSITVIVAVLYVLFVGARFVTPEVFIYLFNLQFLGADVASLLPSTLSFGDFVITGVILVGFTWAMMYLWAWLYNRMAR